MSVTDLPELLSVEQVRELAKARTQKDHLSEALEAERQYQYLKPLPLAAEGLIEVLADADGRYMTGITELDLMTRGFGRSELAMLTARPHMGKTQVVLNSIVNNPSKRTILYTPDEVAELVLSKLVSIKYGVNAEDIERRVKTGEKEATDMLRHAAAHDFANLVVIDESLSLKQMTDALNEAQDYWGEQADLAIIDYLELIPGDLEGGEGVVAKAQGVKRWCKNAALPVICLHQASRSSGNRGQAAGMGAMRFGGEAESIYVIEVFRKREDESLDDFDRRRHSNTLSINLAKNKRPPSKIGCFDVFMDPTCGRIRTLQPDDMVVTGVPVSTIEEAIKARG